MMRIFMLTGFFSIALLGCADRALLDSSELSWLVTTPISSYSACAPVINEDVNKAYKIAKIKAKSDYVSELNSDIALTTTTNIHTTKSNHVITNNYVDSKSSIVETASAEVNQVNDIMLVEQALVYLGTQQQACVLFSSI